MLGLTSATVEFSDKNNCFYPGLKKYRQQWRNDRPEIIVIEPVNLATTWQSLRTKINKNSSFHENVSISLHVVPQHKKYCKVSIIIHELLSDTI
jgi:hypothetical protein